MRSKACQNYTVVMLSSVREMPRYHFYGKTLFNALLVLWLAEQGREVRWYYSAKHHPSTRPLRLSNHSIDQFRIFLKKHDISARFLLEGAPFTGWRNRTEDTDFNRGIAYAERARYVSRKKLFDVLMLSAKSFGVEIKEVCFFSSAKGDGARALGGGY